MNLEELLKYIIWIFFFIVIATALYVALRKMGILG